MGEALVTQCETGSAATLKGVSLSEKRYSRADNIYRFTTDKHALQKKMSKEAGVVPRRSPTTVNSSQLRWPQLTAKGVEADVNTWPVQIVSQLHGG